MAKISYRKIKRGLRHALAPPDSDRYAVRERPEDRFYFRFRLALAGLVVFFGVLVLPFGSMHGKGGWKINTAGLKKYENLLPGKQVLVAYVHYLKERR